MTITNEGSSDDIFNFDFRDDADTLTYKKFITLPNSVELGPGASTSVQVQITVDPYKVDRLAIADGNLKDITIYVYSKGADDNNVAIEGETTKDFLCHVNIEEYKHAFFTVVSPSNVTLDVDSTATVNATIMNEGNGMEQYSFIRDGKNGGGQFIDWYTFNISSLSIAPMESAQVSILVNPKSDAPEGLHNLEFHAKSETTYNTPSASFRIFIERNYGGAFSSVTNKSSNPGNDVRFDISLKNTGNGRNDFRLEIPVLPEGWEEPEWIGSDTRDIPGGSYATFTLEVTIPHDLNVARAGLHQFIMYGVHKIEDGSWTSIPGFARLNLTIHPVYDVQIIPAGTSEAANPGENVTYHLEIVNTGNIDETYDITLTIANGYLDATSWAVLSGTLPQGILQISSGDSVSLDVQIFIPPFDYRFGKPDPGSYGVSLSAVSQSSGSVSDEILLELAVNVTHGLVLLSDKPDDIGIFLQEPTLQLSFPISIHNIGNVFDEIRIFIPTDGFSGDPAHIQALIDGMPYSLVQLDPNAEETLTLDLDVQRAIEPGNYTITIVGESMADPVFTSETLLTFTIFYAPIAIIDSAFPNPSPSDAVIQFAASAQSFGNITRYRWTSSIDRVLYDGNASEFTLSNISQGTHVLSLAVQDEHGIWSQEVTTLLDIHLRPTISLISIQPNPAVVGQPIQFFAQGHDDGSVISYEWSSSIDQVIYSGPNLEFSNANLSLGTHTISLQVQDNFGVLSSPVLTTTTIVKGNSLPEATFESHSEMESAGGVVTLSGGAFDADGHTSFVEISIEGGAWQRAGGNETWSYDWDTTTIENGVYDIRIRAYDGSDYSMIQDLNLVVSNHRDDDAEGNPNGLYILVTSLLILVAMLFFVIFKYEPN